MYAHIHICALTSTEIRTGIQYGVRRTAININNIIGSKGVDGLLTRDNSENKLINARTYYRTLRDKGKEKRTAKQRRAI